MPISFDLEEFRKKHNIVNYFETGLYDVRFDVSCKKALNCGFKKLYKTVFKLRNFEWSINPYS